MKKNFKCLMNVLFISVLFAGATFAAEMTGHTMAASDRVGDLIHESEVDGYMIAYHFMDLRDQKDKEHSMDTMDGSQNMAKKEMDKPHHLMVYIMDKNHKPVLKGKVGFVIKDAQGNAQKAMGMFMSNGFGTTADMKKKGVYTITMKAILGDKTIMDHFEYDIK